MKFYVVILGIALANISPAWSACVPVPQGIVQAQQTVPSMVVGEQRELYGLARFYMHVAFLAYEDSEWQQIKTPYTSTCLIAAKGRFEALIAGPNAAVSENGEITSLTILRVQEDALFGPTYGPLRYLIWHPLAWLSGLGAALLDWLHGFVDWGIAIILLGLLIRIVFHPLEWFTARAQSYISKQQVALAPSIAAIKRDFKGEEAYEMTMAVYRELGISPFFKLRGIIGPMLQIPVMIAVFNLLGGLEALRGQSFLWIGDLSMPDHVALLPKAVPFFGDRISLLPLIMAGVSVMSAVTFHDPFLTRTALRVKRRNLLWFGLIFLILLYPFPSAIVLYWTTANLIQWLERQILSQYLRSGR
jgi:YidC/Oxa1 family membrane protein insertase